MNWSGTGIESSSRSALITAWRESFSLDVTRSWSPWMRTCTLGDTARAFFWSDLARSSEIPAFSFTSTCLRPLPTVLGSEGLNSFAGRLRLAAFSTSTWTAARAQTAVLDAEPAPAADDADPLADGLDRGAVVALLASARTK